MKKIAWALLLMLLVPLAACADVDWSSDIITADGYGSPPQNPVNPAQSSIMARRAAVADGYRSLLEQIGNVCISGDTTVQNAMAVNDTIKAGVDSVVNGAKVVKENWTPEGAYHVVLQVKLFGAGGLASKIFPGSGIGGGKKTAAFPVPGRQVSPGNVSGVVIDCRGLNLQRALAPAVYDTGGRVVYSARYLDDQELYLNGVCDYDQQDAMKMPSFRAGSTPLLIVPSGLRDSGRNIVVSVTDADLMLVANSEHAVLRKACVVLLIK